MTRLVFCEFGSADAIVGAARRLRDLGFTNLEAYTPYAIHELEPILGLSRSRIPWAALAAGVFGTLFAFGVLWYCNAYDYPLDVGGRPRNSIPADVPIAFETAILFAALTTFALVLVRSGLPRLHDPSLVIEGFERASIDRYWLRVALDDGEAPVFDRALEEVGALSVRGRVGES